MKPKSYNRRLIKNLRTSMRCQHNPYTRQHAFPYNALVNALPKVWYLKPRDDLDECMVFASKAQAKNYLSEQTYQDHELIHCTVKEAKQQAAQNCISFLRRHSTYGHHPYQSYGDMFRTIVI